MLSRLQTPLSASPCASCSFSPETRFWCGWSFLPSFVPKAIGKPRGTAPSAMRNGLKTLTFLMVEANLTSMSNTSVVCFDRVASRAGAAQRSENIAIPCRGDLRAGAVGPPCSLSISYVATCSNRNRDRDRVRIPAPNRRPVCRQRVGPKRAPDHAENWRAPWRQHKKRPNDCSRGRCS